MFTTDNHPNAAKLMDSLRYLGYNNYSALCDIIDNAFDAEAKNVHVTINQVAGEPLILITDDGTGMDKKTLDEALKLGSLTDRNAGSDLGKYGMGLVTASLSIAKRTSVLTRSNGSLLKSVTDVDEVKKRNAFCKFLGEASPDDVLMFNETISAGGTGTIVELSKCDNLKNTNLTVFRNTLRGKLGQVYRYFLLSGKKIFLNGDEVAARDPLMIDEGAEIYSDDRFDLTVTGADGKEFADQVRVRIAVLPDFGSDGNKDRKIGMRSQGFYILRNNREIAEGETLGLFTRHNDLNRFRGEIFFSGAFDEAMGVNFTKRDLDPTQAILHKINELVQGQLRTIRNRIKTARITSEDSEITHDESEKLINAKSHLLIRPKPQKNSAGAGTNDGDGSNGWTGDAKRGSGKSSQAGKSSAVPGRFNVRFEAVKLGKTGPIYEAEQTGKVTVVQWNIEHPFYERFVLERKDDQTLRTSVDFLVYSMATAELTTLNEENYEMIQNIKAVMSSNLRSLLA